MRSRFLRATLIAVAAALLSALLLTAVLAERQYTEEVRTHLDAILVVSAGRLRLEARSQDVDWPAFADTLARELERADQEVRVTLIGLDGTVIGDSAADDLAELENHGQRPEVLAAIADGWGHNQRGSTVVDGRMYYAARLVDDLVLRVSVPMQRLLYFRWFLAGTAAVGLLVGLGVAVAAVTPLIRRLTKPILGMTGAARRYAEGDFSLRMQPAAHELGYLSEAFNDMADRLERSHADLRESNQKLNSVLQGMDDGIIAMDGGGTFLLLTDRLQQMLGPPADDRSVPDAGPMYLHLHDTMRDAIRAGQPIRREWSMAHPEERLLDVYATPLHPDRADAALAVVSDVTRIRKLERIRSEFVSNVTHELKTPLTSIRGYVELLKDGTRDAETMAQFYEIIEIEAERLQALIDDLLQLSEIEEGRHETPAQDVQLSVVADGVIRRLLPVAEKQGVRIRADLDATVRMQASPVRMEQLLYNLVDNAIKYNRTGGEVQVSVYRERHFAVVDISDTGIGIPEEHQERIFERFYRVDKSRSRELGGTGLGLSIVKHIVSLYGGDIHVISEAGKGSRFILRFP